MGSSWKRQGVEEPFCHDDRRMGEHTFLTFSSSVRNSLIKWDKFCQPTSGRHTELTALTQALVQASAGHGQVVAAVGEAGAGKSRLMYEFKATIPDGCKVLEAYSVSVDWSSGWLPPPEV